jgi:transposase
MSETEAGARAGRRRSKRLLSPTQKYEIWLQLVRQEVTIAEAAAAHQVDRSTIMRIRTVAKEGALGFADNTDSSRFTFRRTYARWFLT